MQIRLDFTHTIEDTPQNQAFLRANRHRLSNLCQLMYNALMTGDRMTTYQANQLFNQTDGRRRFKDLKDAGVHLSQEVVRGHKVWYMSESDKIYNKQNF